MTADPVAGRAAVAGIGQTAYAKNLGRTELDLACEAILTACDDAGFPVDEIDGLVSYSIEQVSEVDLVTTLGIENLSFMGRTTSGGGGAAAIAGMAAMLICIFLGPRFIEYLRLKEFGQHIREEGPQEHHEKAGTPTMGGLIIFTAISIPYLVLSDRDAQSLAVFGVALGCAGLGFADDFV